MNLEDIATDKTKFCSTKTIAKVISYLHHKCFVKTYYDHVQSDNRIYVLCKKNDINYVKHVAGRSNMEAIVSDQTIGEYFQLLLTGK